MAIRRRVSARMVMMVMIWTERSGVRLKVGVRRVTRKNDTFDFVLCGVGTNQYWLTVFLRSRGTLS